MLFDPFGVTQCNAEGGYNFPEIHVMALENNR
jgi:hypothetical protein